MSDQKGESQKAKLFAQKIEEIRMQKKTIEDLKLQIDKYEKDMIGFNTIVDQYTELLEMCKSMEAVSGPNEAINKKKAKINELIEQNKESFKTNRELVSINKSILVRELAKLKKLDDDVSQILQSTGEDDLYKNKYLKYKNKYLHY
jgi:hypothetical protein